MPWRTSTVETARARFVMEAELSDLSHAELCRRHGISRPTGYKWIRRYREKGLGGLESRFHATRSCPHITSATTVERILQLRDKRDWGARKIHRKLRDDPEVDEIPCVDTVHRILKRHGRVEPKKPRRRRTRPGPPLPIEPEPNATWTADFKGEFRTTDGRLCYPLTIQDGHTRFLFDIRGMLRIDQVATNRSFTRLFREHGLPRRIRTDNGPPFSTKAIAGLSELSVWWISLGILPDRIEPGKPQQNGRHERMHRTLKKRTANPPRATIRAQQRRFNEFRRLDPPVEEPKGLRQQPSQVPHRRPGADRRRGLVRLFRTGPPRLARRSRPPHHGRQEPSTQTPLICKRSASYVL